MGEALPKKNGHPYLSVFTTSLDLWGAAVDWACPSSAKLFKSTMHPSILSDQQALALLSEFPSIHHRLNSCVDNLDPQKPNSWWV